MANFFAELKRRHIYRVAAAYAVVAWVLLQLVNNLAPGLNLPTSALTLVIVLLALGFPLALLFCWIQHVGRADAEGAAKPQSTRLDYVLAGALLVVIALVSYQQVARSPDAPPSAASVPTEGISIAVLPFTNLSSDPEQEFFSDGMTEEITAALAKVPDLRVVARTSAFEFKGQNRNIQTIGQTLQASHLIEGSVRKEGNQLRITAQLIRAADGLHLWAESYDRELTGVFVIQEDIAKAIAGALRVPLGLGVGGQLVSNRTDDLESYQQYLRARALYRARALTEAIALLEPVVARDPGFAPAWALLAQVYGFVPGYEVTVMSGPAEPARRATQSALDKADRAAREAIRLDPKHAGGYAALAYVQANLKNWAASDDLFRQALALDPDDPDALHLSSSMLIVAGRLKQSMTVREKLRTLEPFVPIYNITTAEFMQSIGQGRASIPILEAVPPGGALTYNRNSGLARAYAAEGRYAEAAETLLSIGAQNRVSRRSVEDAARLLRTAPAKAGAPEALPVLEAELNFVYAYIGAPGRLLESAERAVEVGRSMSTSMRVVWHPLYAAARKTERFKTLVRNAGLVDYWRARGWPDLCRPMGADDFVCD